MPTFGEGSQTRLDPGSGRGRQMSPAYHERLLDPDRNVLQRPLWQCYREELHFSIILYSRLGSHTYPITFPNPKVSLADGRTLVKIGELKSFTSQGMTVVTITMGNVASVVSIYL